jgi:ankyrin repeat protein
VWESVPLLEAALLGYLEVVRLLLQGGADPNLADSEGLTPLMHSAREGHLEVARLLLERGVDVDTVWRFRYLQTRNNTTEMVMRNMAMDNYPQTRRHATHNGDPLGRFSVGDYNHCMSTQTRFKYLYRNCQSCCHMVRLT